MIAIALFIVILGLSNGFISAPMTRSTRVSCFSRIYPYSASQLASSNCKSSLSALSSSVEDDSIITDINNSGSFVSKVKNAVRVLYKFSRPHTIKVSPP